MFGVPLTELATLDVDEVARLLVNYMRTHHLEGRKLNRHNMALELTREGHQAGMTEHERNIASAKASAAWRWLENHWMIVPDPSQSGSDWAMLTEAANELEVPDYLLDLRAQELLGRHDLDPELEDQVRRQFRRAAYGDAVFAAMRLVEVRVRAAARLTRRDIGKDLMFKAFNPGGPLADPELLASENEGRAHLFAGAMGLIKNQHSHTIVRFEEPFEAAELVLLANTLLRTLGRATVARATREAVVAVTVAVSGAGSDNS